MPKNAPRRKPAKKGKRKPTPRKGMPRSQIVQRTSPPITRPMRHPSRAHHVMSACSITDPFCVHAKAARRPDGLSSNAMPYQVRFMELISTDAAGKARSFFASGFGLYCRAVATLAAGTWTIPASFENTGVATSFLLTNAQEVRIVSFGVILRTITSATNSQGLMTAGSLGFINAALTFPEGQTSFDESVTQSLAAGTELSWISKPVGTSAHDFTTDLGWVNTGPFHDWTSLSVEVIGGPVSTPVISAEIFVNIEFTIKSTAGMSSMLPPTKPLNTVAIKAQEAVHSSVPSLIEGGVERVGKFLESKAGAAVDDFLSGALAFLGI